MKKLLFAFLITLSMTFGQISIQPASGGVGGSVNLTTIGAIPYVSAAGVLSQDTPGIHWDATNNRLGIGTAAPTQAIHAVANIADYVMNIVQNSTSGAGVDITVAGSTSANNIVRLNNAGGSLVFSIRNDGQAFLGGVVGIGPSNTSPTGTLHVYDATASTGVTKETLRDGAGQSTTPLLVFQNSSGTTQVGMHWNASGVAEINNGTAGTFRDLKLRELVATTGTEGTCDSSNRGRVVFVAGGAGVADTWRICRKDAADAYAFTALF